MTQFETLEFSGNDLSGVTLEGDNVRALFFLVTDAITLIGTAASSIVMRGNSAKGMTVSGSADVEVLLWEGPYAGTQLVSGVSTVVIDGFDARDGNMGNQVTYEGSLMALFFFGSNGFTMVNAGSININNVWLGGRMRFFRTDNINPIRSGVKVALFRTLTGVNSIAVTDSYIDMGTGSGLEGPPKIRIYHHQPRTPSPT